MARPTPVRKNNYHRLREAGFNSYDATKYKDYNDWVIENLITAKHYFKEHVNIIVKERGKKND